MSKFFQIVAAILVMLGVASLCSCRYEVSSDCDKSQMVAQMRQVKPFDKIDAAGSMTVYYEQGNKTSVKVIADKDDQDYIKTYVDNGVLHVEKKSRIILGIGHSCSAEVYVTSPDLIDVNMAGSGSFISSKHVDTDNLSVSLAGSGDVKFEDIICDRIEAELVGSGDVNIKKVVCGEAKFSCVGSGDFNAGVNRARKTEISLQGSGDMCVDAKDCGSVSGNLAGSGDITVNGNVKEWNHTVMGSGDYHTDNLHTEK
jgi:hypothetical protein